MGGYLASGMWVIERDKMRKRSTVDKCVEMCTERGGA